MKQTKKKTVLNKIPQDTTIEAPALPRKMAESYVKRRLSYYEVYALGELREQINRCFEDTLELETYRNDPDILETLLSAYDELIEKTKDGSYRLEPIEKKLQQLKKQTIELHKEAYKFSLKHTLLKTVGRRRINPDLGYLILRTIDYCEEYKVDIDWLKNFLSPTGPLYNFLLENHSEINIATPIPSTDSFKQRNWLHKLKESLQRSVIYKPNEKVKKGKDAEFLERRQNLYLKIKRDNKNFRDQFRIDFLKGGHETSGWSDDIDD